MASRQICEEGISYEHTHVHVNVCFGEYLCQVHTGHYFWGEHTQSALIFTPSPQWPLKRRLPATTLVQATFLPTSIAQSEVNTNNGPLNSCLLRIPIVGIDHPSRFFFAIWISPAVFTDRILVSCLPPRCPFCLSEPMGTVDQCPF